MNMLFVCSRNRWRSPTAEHVFSSHPGLVTSSAGIAKDAEEVLTEEHLRWAHVVVGMERKHTQEARRIGQRAGVSPRYVVLGIPDKYPYMDPLLVALLQRKMATHLPCMEPS